MNDNYQFSFWKEGDLNQKYFLMGPELEPGLKKFLLGKNLEWIQARSAEQITTRFIKSPEGLFSSFQEAELEQILFFCKPVIYQHENSRFELQKILVSQVVGIQEMEESIWQTGIRKYLDQGLDFGPLIIQLKSEMAQAPESMKKTIGEKAVTLLQQL